MLLFLIGAVVAAIVFGVQAYNEKQAEKRLEELAAQTDPSKESQDGVVKVEELMKPLETPAPENATQEAEPQVDEAEEYLAFLKEMDIPIPEKEVDFEDLTANTNADIYAWIYIPDTKIDYPVLQHPTDNTYYLERNLDGSKGYPGCIYTEDYNSKEFTDPNTVLYGHNMINGSMFAGLHKFADMEYLKEHPYVYIYTPERMYVYQIFAAYEYSNAHLLLNYDFTSEVVFKNYLQEIRELRSMTYNYLEDVEVTAADRIITLSTCIKTKPDNRYLVQGVLLNEN